ncbi:SpoIID/LytB domain-containing protein [bacterium]|nr:SpoIID/LytB domain-containing protein [bacterium]
MNFSRALNIITTVLVLGGICLIANTKPKKKVKHHQEKIKIVNRDAQQIRVLISEHPLRVIKKISLTAEPEQKLVLSSLDGKAKKKLSSIELAIVDGMLYSKKGDESYHKLKGTQFDITPTSGHTNLWESSYDGTMRLEIDQKKNQLLVINILPLEDYLYSVLLTEVYQSWPSEMHQVQAIASRSYAMYHIKNPNGNGKFYDVKNSNHNQVYNGKHKYTHLRDAIRKTRGIVVTHKDKVALTMFDACCGGVIPANVDRKEVHQFPYLARDRRCVYCRGYSLFNWKQSINNMDLAFSLRSHPLTQSDFKNVGMLKNIKVVSKDKAGVAQELMLVGDKSSAKIKGRSFYEALGKTTCYSLNIEVKNKAAANKATANKNDFEICGKGFGHHLGLCQRGARELVRKGWSVPNILKFYYPNTTLKVIS